MTRNRTGLVLLLGLFAAGALPAQVERVSYVVVYKADVLDRAFVSAAFHGKPQDRLAVEIPRWSPGAYELQDFWKFVENVRATDAAGKELAVAKEGDLRWNVATAGAAWPVAFEYERLDQNDGIGARRAKRRKADYVSFLPTNTYVYAVGAKNVPHDVRFDVPESWLVRTALEPGEKPRSFRAPNYDEIVDAPVELGHLTVRNFTVGGVPYAIVLDRRDSEFPLTSLEDLCRRAVRHQVGMFGGKAPWPRYEFHFHEGMGWGLEHLTSQSNGVPIGMMKAAGVGIFDGLIAHETFHAWNVKRIRPQVLGPFDYTGPNRTKHLWFSEGVTDYYADLTCRRTGLWDDEKFLSTLRGEVQKLQRNRARLFEPISETSLLAFDRGYAAQLTGAGLDYYNKGKLLGLLLDLTIRRETKGARSLDDVMRALMDKYGYPKPGFAEDALVAEFSTVAGSDLRPFFARYVEGCAELPYGDVLAFVGVEAAAQGEVNRAAAARLVAEGGVSVEGGKIVLKKVGPFGAAYGLKDGDVLAKVNGAAPAADGDPADVLERAFEPKEKSATFAVVVLRDGKEASLAVELPRGGRFVLRRAKDASAAAKAAYDAWLADPYTALVEPGESGKTEGL